MDSTLLCVYYTAHQVGQYMMTLPQHLEPFTMQDNPAVLVALRHGRLPYTDDTGII